MIFCGYSRRKLGKIIENKALKVRKVCGRWNGVPAPELETGDAMEYGHQAPTNTVVAGTTARKKH